MYVLSMLRDSITMHTPPPSPKHHPNPKPHPKTTRPAKTDYDPEEPDGLGSDLEAASDDKLENDDRHHRLQSDGGETGSDDDDGGGPRKRARGGRSGSASPRMEGDEGPGCEHVACRRSPTCVVGALKELVQVRDPCDLVLI